jgi:hypothetical protein
MHAVVGIRKQVADSARAYDQEVFPLQGQLGLFLPEIEQADGKGAILHGLGDCLVEIAAGYPHALPAEGILVHGKHLVVREKAEGEGVEVGQIAAEEQRR